MLKIWDLRQFQKWVHTFVCGVGVVWVWVWVCRCVGVVWVGGWGWCWCVQVLCLNEHRHLHLNGTRCANVCTVCSVNQSEVSVNKKLTETVGRGGGGAGLCGRVWVGLG